MIIFGFRRTVATMAMLTLACRNGHVAVHRLVKATRWFTLFFVPLIPFNRKYLTVCAQCGIQVTWSRSDAEAAVEASTQPAGSPDPVAPPVTTGAWATSGAGASQLVPPLPTGPPAGWYADPGGGAQRRFWNGSAWTDMVEQG
jgi:hypothetical protein